MRTERVRRGFVLMEAVVALAIIALVAIALLETTSTQVRTANKATRLLVARSLAEDRLTAIQLLDYDDLRALPDSLASGMFAPPYQDYGWAAEVTEMEEEYDLFEAQVVVTGFGETFPIRTLIHAPRPVFEVAAEGGGRGGGGGGGGGRGGRAGRGRGGGGDDEAQRGGGRRGRGGARGARGPRGNRGGLFGGGIRGGGGTRGGSGGIGGLGGIRPPPDTTDTTTVRVPR